MKHREVTAAVVRQLFDYSPETGELTHRRRAGRKQPGDRAGELKRDGYRHVGIFGSKYMEHRIVFLWVHGRWPNPEADHRNRVRDDNRIDNLIEATHRQNALNRAPRKRGNDLPTGVRRRGNRFYAYIGGGGSQRHLGSFASPEAAHAAYRTAHAAALAEAGRGAA